MFIKLMIQIMVHMIINKKAYTYVRPASQRPRFRTFNGAFLRATLIQSYYFFLCLQMAAFFNILGSREGGPRVSDSQTSRLPDSWTPRVPKSQEEEEDEEEEQEQ